MQEFIKGSVPVSMVAKVYGKDQSWVRAGIIAGWLPIRKATRNGQLTMIDIGNSFGYLVKKDNSIAKFTISFMNIKNDKGDKYG